MSKSYWDGIKGSEPSEEVTLERNGDGLLNQALAAEFLSTGIRIHVSGESDHHRQLHRSINAGRRWSNGLIRRLKRRRRKGRAGEYDLCNHHAAKLLPDV
jgi:hypothetical protein